MSLGEKIQLDLKQAMSSKDELRLLVLRMVKSEIANREKEKRSKLAKEGQEEGLEQKSKLSDEEIAAVLSSEAKKRKDSIKQYEEGRRSELAEQEKKELAVLEEYLPEQMSEEEIRQLAQKKISETGAEGPQDTGRVMGSLMPEVKGKADGGLVNKIVQEELKK